MSGEEKKYTQDEAHRFFGVSYNNEIFKLYDKESLSKYEAERIIHLAHASLLHWQDFSDHQIVNTQRGLYMTAKAYIKVGEKENALKYAQECHQLTFEQEEAMKDFDLAYASEILARAAKLNGDLEKYEQCKKEFQHYKSLIKNTEDLKWVEQDGKDL